MKNSIFTPIIFLLFLLGSLSGCNDDKEFKDVNVTAVKNLYEPAEDRYIVLQSAGNVYFEWEKANAEDNSIVYYEILFDKTDGDFSNPLYLQASDGKGLNTGVTFTPATLNRIAKMAGAARGDEITLKWTVRSNRGVNFVMAEQSRKVTLVRMINIDPLQDGEKMYITGEGSEEGQEVFGIERNKALVYEIYTQLEANKPYSFYSDLKGKKRTFSVNADNVSIVETTDETPVDAVVATAGIYRITMDLETATCSLAKIESIVIHHCTSNGTLLTFNYTGAGIWEGVKANFATSTGNKDDRYKIKMITAPDKIEWWGPVTPTDGKPTGDPSYFNMVISPAKDQWNPKWKFVANCWGKTATAKLTLTGGVYTHSIVFN